jgi:hypothetical protein
MDMCVPWSADGIEAQIVRKNEQDIQPAVLGVVQNDAA